MQDNALLAQYVRDGSEAAFAQLLARHLPLVLRTCRRELGADTLAEDAAQVVFLLLARKAKTLRAGPSLAGWLYQTAVFVAKDVRKQEARRTRREEAVMQETLHAQAAPASEWSTVEPHLNAALSALKPADRDAVLLRFLEGHTLADTGALLGVSEDAARMRCARALEKLRRTLTAHGAAVTGVVLVALLTAEAARPVSAQAASAVTRGTLQSLANSPAPNVLLLSKGVSHTMKLIKIKYAVLAAIILLAGASVPLLVHALGHSPRISQRAAAGAGPPANAQRLAFQIGAVLNECDLGAEDYRSQVSSISGLLNQPTVAMAEINQAYDQVPRVRAEQARLYQRAALLLRQGGAPPALTHWYFETGARFSKPPLFSEAVKADLRAEAKAEYAAIQFTPQAPADPTFGTEAQLSADLAARAELQTSQAEAAQRRPRLLAWLTQHNPSVDWDIRLGAFAGKLHQTTATVGGFLPKMLIQEADGLRQTAPLDAPEGVRQSLAELVSVINTPGTDPKLVVVVPGKGIALRLDRVYDHLCRSYGAETAHRQL